MARDMKEQFKYFKRKCFIQGEKIRWSGDYAHKEKGTFSYVLHFSETH